MTPEQQQQLNELIEFKRNLESFNTIPLKVDQAFTGRGYTKLPGGLLTVSSGGTGVATITGIIKGNGSSVFTGIVPLSGTKIYYVSDSSGGAVTRKLTFTDGVLTSET